MQVLYLNSSILKDFSVSDLLAHEIISHIQSKYNDVSVVERDLGTNPPAHITLEVLTAIRSCDPSQLTTTQQQEYQSILQSIQELKDADLIVMGAPMYNLSISGGLKAWIDQVCQAGLTFSYTETGPKGLIDNKPVIIASARGGTYSTEPNCQVDHHEPYLIAVLALIGITDVKIIRAEGVSISPEMKQQAIDQAKEAIQRL